MLHAPRTRRLAALLLPLALVALAACGSGGEREASPTPEPGTGKVRVVASTELYASLVRRVGGDRVEVRALLTSTSQDPHEYQSSPADAAAVERAQVVVVNGGGYDRFLAELADGARSQPVVLDAVARSGLPGAATAGGDGAPPFNEHVWYSLAAMRSLVGALGDALAEADPAHAEAVRSRAASTVAAIDGLSARVAALRGKVAGRPVAVTEPVPLLLLQDLGLEDRTPAAFSEAVEEGEDPPATALKEELDLVRDRKVRLLAYNAQTASALTEQVRDAAKAAGVPTVEVFETLPPGVDDYVAFMGSQLDALAAALGGP